MMLPVYAETLNFLNWEDYIDRSVLQEWSSRTGVKINEVYIDTGDERDALLGDPSNEIDLVLMNEGSAKLFGKRGILAPLDDAKLPAMGEYKPERLARCAGYGLPYFWGTMGILYRTDKVSPPPKSWHDLMTPAPRFYGHIAMFKDTKMTFVAPLAMLGRPISSGDDSILKEAYEALKVQAPAVLTYDYVMTSSQDPAIRDEIWLALGYSGDQHALNARPYSPGTWSYVLPEEGSLYWQDCISVTGTSRKKDLAFDLLNHIAGQASARRNALIMNMPPTNEKALEALPPAMRNDASTFPPAEILARSQSIEEIPADAMQRRRRIINALVTFRDPR